MRTVAPSFPRCAAASSVRGACAVLVDELHERWQLPSVYLLVDGRLRCQASRGYFQVSDGFPPSTGVIGQVVSGRRSVVLEDVRSDAAFLAAIPGLRSEICCPVWVHGEVVGAVNLESPSPLGAAALGEVEHAAQVLGRRIEELGGLPRPSLAERLARIAVGLAGQTDAQRVQAHAVEGALAISGKAGAAVAVVDPCGRWSVAHSAGPLGAVLSSWDDQVLSILGGWVWAGTSSYFTDGPDVPRDLGFLVQGVAALSVHPLAVAGQVTGLLLVADDSPVPHDPAHSTALELLAAQTASTLAMVRSLEHLEQQARQDQLTGLVNRRGLLHALEGEAGRGGEGCALVLLDLDGFKAVNDRHGHATGDAVLCAVARQLEASVRPGDLVCRLGGDEFALLVRDVHSPAEALAFGTRLVAAVEAPVAVDGRSAVGGSVGIRRLTATSASALLVDADVALYAAKRAGRGRAVLWSPALRAEELDQQTLVEELMQALDDGSLSLAYQPVVDITTLRVRGIEALARWDHPVRGPVSPARFVACAERAGRIRDLTRWVLGTAMREAASWPAAEDGEYVNIAINISAAQLGDEIIVYDVQEALLATGIPPGRVVLEVTETAQVVDLGRAKLVLGALSDLGVVLALDDFGTGYSSLSHAQALPFDILKIDRSFVAGAAAGDRGAGATVAAICALAAGLEVDVVAEGVEDQAQLLHLSALGCHYAQGFALARPLPAAEVAAALALQSGPGWVLDRRLPALTAAGARS